MTVPFLHTLLLSLGLSLVLGRGLPAFAVTAPCSHASAWPPPDPGPRTRPLPLLADEAL